MMGPVLNDDSHGAKRPTETETASRHYPGIVPDLAPKHDMATRQAGRPDLPSQPGHEAAAQPAFRPLGYFGLVPFGFGAIIVWLAPWLISVGEALIIERGTLVYGAIIASYMAGIGAGGDLGRERPGVMTYLPSMLAALFAWLAALPDGYFFISLSETARVTILAAVFGFLYFRDMSLITQGIFSPWYGRLRFRLTGWVIIALLSIAVRMITWNMV